MHVLPGRDSEKLFRTRTSTFRMVDTWQANAVINTVKYTIYIHIYISTTQPSRKCLAVQKSCLCASIARRAVLPVVVVVVVALGLLLLRFCIKVFDAEQFCSFRFCPRLWGLGLLRTGSLFSLGSCVYGKSLEPPLFGRWSLCVTVPVFLFLFLFLFLSLSLSGRPGPSTVLSEYK